MSKRRREYVALVVYFLSAMFLGYLREKFFVDINYLMYYKYYYNTKPWIPAPAPWALHFLGKVDYENLYFLKVPFTVIFSSLFFLFGAGLYWVVKKKHLIRYFSMFYIVLFLAAGILTISGVFIWQRWDSPFYGLSRRFVGIEQSPIPALAIYIAAGVLEKFTPKKDEYDIIT